MTTAPTIVLVFALLTNAPAGPRPWKYQGCWNGTNIAWLETGVWSVTNPPPGTNTFCVRAIDPNRHDCLATSAWSQIVLTNIPAKTPAAVARREH